MSGISVRFAKEFKLIDNYLKQRENFLNTKVLEAGGGIESRMLTAGFTDRYVFTKEQLERFIQLIKEQANEPQ